MDKDCLLREIKAAWVKEDKEDLKTLLCEAFYLEIDKDEIFKALKGLRFDVNEDFEEWAYMLIVTEGNSDCTPG